LPSTNGIGNITNSVGACMTPIDREQELFGNRNRTALLLAVSLLDETYPSELAQVLGVRLYTVQSILAKLEREGVLVSRLLGRMRRVSLSPRFFAYRELSILLSKLGKHDLALQQSLAARRRRPRRVGKPGLP
jgi:DNA-binding transcriptional ArsR family regulator